MDIIDKLIDLHKQATEERSHYYVAQTCRDAINEITRLRLLVLSLEKKANALRRPPMPRGK